MSEASEFNQEIDVAGRWREHSKISEENRLQFAKNLLLWLGIVCISVFIGYSAMPENPALKAIFELLKIGVLPLITLVVSFYFPNAK